MPIRHITGRARDIKRHLIDEVGAALSSGEHPVIVLVPEQFTLEAELAVIDALNLPGSFRFQVLSPARLFSRVFAEAGQSDAVRIDERGRVMAMYASLKRMRRALTWYRDAQHKSGFSHMAAEQIAELKQSGFTRQSLAELARAQPAGPLQYKLDDLALIWDAYDAALGGRFLDGEDEMAEALRRLPDAPFFKGCALWAYGFEMVSRTLAEILLAFEPVAQTVTLALALESDGSARDFHIFAPVQRTFDRFQREILARGISWERVRADAAPSDLPPDIAHLERELFCYPPIKRASPPTAVQLARLKNPLDEALFAASLARHLVKARGWRYRDITIAFESLETYAEPLERACALYDVPLFLESSRPAGRHPVAGYLLGALELVASGYQSEDVERLMRTGYTDLTDDECDRLINYALSHGVERSGWTRPFKRGDADALPALEALRDALMAPILRLGERLKAATDLSGQLEAAWALMEEIGAHARLEADIARLTELGLRPEANESAQVWNRLVETFDQMHHLAAGPRLSARDLCDMLTQSLMASVIKPLPQSNDAVEAGRISRLRSHPVKALILIGINDRSGARQSGLFLPAERQTLAEAPDVWLPPDALERDRLAAIDIKGALSLVREYVIVTCADSDEDGSVLMPGRLVMELHALFPGLTARGGLSEDEAMRRMRLNAPQAAFARLAPLMRADPGDALAQRAFGALGALAEHRASAQIIRRALRHRVASEPLDADLARRLYGGPSGVSVTRLEQFSGCPFRHFVHYGLRPDPVHPYEFTPQIRGTFFHDALEKFMLTDEAGADIAASLRRMDAITEELLAPLMDGPLGESPVMVAHSRRVRQIARRAAGTIARHFEGSRFVPFAVEVDFGELAQAVTVGADQLPLSGRIDRIDRWVSPDGAWLRVVDYKSGRAQISLPEFYFGLQLQLIVYMAAALNWTDGRPAGVFYFHVGDPVIKTYARACDAVEREREDALKLDGLFVDDRQVIDALSPKAERIMNVQFNKDQSLRKGTRAFSERTFHALIGHALDTAARLAHEIRGGATAIAPARMGDLNACTFCEYASVCQIDAHLPGGDGRRIEKISAAEALERIVGEQSAD